MTKILTNKSNIDLDYPICRPSLDLDFTQEELDPRITFTRGSIGTRVNRNRVIETVAANVPRFDYDPVTGECKGLLIEESRTNLFTYSEEFDNPIWISWFGESAPATPNQIVSPDGNTTADLITFTPNYLGQSRKEQNIGTQSGTYTASVFVKRGTISAISLYVSSSKSPTYPNVSYDFNTDILTNDGVTSTRTFYSNGWIRITATATLTSHTMVSGLIAFSRGTLYVWGLQVEAGAFPTSYIPTVASTVTRSADLASVTGTNFSSWYNQSEGTIYAKWSYPFTPSGYPGIFNFGDTSYQNGYSITTNLVNNNRFGARGSNVVIFDTFGINSVSPNFVATSSLSYITNSTTTSISYSGNGSIASVTKNAPIVNINKALIGNNNDSGNYLSGHIKRLTYYPRALKPNHLQYLTQ